MGDGTPVPWRHVDSKQMLYPLDHNAPQVNIMLTFYIFNNFLRVVLMSL